MERDSIIDIKINELNSKKEKINNELRNLGNYITNLIIKTDATNFNLRTCSNINEIYKAYKYVINEYNNINIFNNILIDNYIDEKVIDNINGYSINDWEHDIIILCKKITLSNRIKKINSYIEQLEKFYSDNRQEENKFNDLIASINNI